MKSYFKISEKLDNLSHKELDFKQAYKFVNFNRKISDESLVPIMYNSSINVYKDGFEIIKYNEPVKVVPQLKKDEFIDYALSDFGLIVDEFNQVDRSRMLRRDEEGNIKVNRSGISYFDMFDKIKFNNIVSRKRTLNNLYSYALSNIWNYFFTLTIDRSKYNSTDSSIINGYYKEFMRKLRTVDVNVKGLFILEYHKDKENLHLHGFIKGKLSDVLTRAYNPHTNEPIVDSIGNDIYNCSLWDYGFNSCAVFQSGYNKLRVANYLTKYISKDFIKGSIIPYGTKMLYRSRDLDSRISFNTNLSDIDLCCMLKEYYYDKDTNVNPLDFRSDDFTKLSVCKKSNDKMTVYFLPYYFKEAT